MRQMTQQEKDFLTSVCEKEPRIQQIISTMENIQQVPSDALANAQSFYWHFKALVLPLVGWTAKNPELQSTDYYSAVISKIREVGDQYEKAGHFRNE